MATRSVSPRHEYLQKQARKLYSAARSGDAACLARIRAVHPNPPADAASAKLHHAQLAVAREQGYKSWPSLRAALNAEAAGAFCRPFVRDLAYYEDRARGFLSVFQEGQARAYELTRLRHPEYAHATDLQLRSAALTDEDANLVVARDHGFANWSSFAAYVAAIRQGDAVEPFLQAFESLKQGDIAEFERLLDEHPDLVNARGTNGNTLLNLSGSLRQMSGVEALLARGADVNLANEKGWMPLHQAAYSNQVCLVDTLLAAGAIPDVVGYADGGTPLIVALFWGHREAAGRLARETKAPFNLRVAAGLGDEEMLRSLFTASGAPTPEAGLHRAFHRPHSGFPAWTPSDDPTETLNEALAWAARNDRVNSLAFLVECGADVNADVYRGTPLAWAAATGRITAAKWLLKHGADVNLRATFGGPSHGEGTTALHLAASDDKLELIRLLLAHGADATVRDGNYQSPPYGWAEHFGHEKAARLLLESAANTDLLAAVRLGSLQQVRSLLDAGAHELPGEPPLHAAARLGRMEIVRLLLEHGFDPFARNQDEKTAVEVARENGHAELAEVLESSRLAVGEG